MISFRKTFKVTFKPLENICRWRNRSLVIRTTKQIWISDRKMSTQQTLKSSEEILATSAASSDPALNPALPTFFDKLVSKEVPCDILFEDDVCMAFRDISPQGPKHFLVIPKNKDGLNRLSNAREDQKYLLGHLVYTAQQVAKNEGLVPNGFRMVINDGPDGSQSVYHMHIHVIGGRQMKWPPG